MAVLTSDGKVVSSGKGKRGMNTCWRRAGSWLQFGLPHLAGRIKAARRGR